ncbi:PTS sugar transporter subunit IIA [Vibrio sp. CK2-1]|uniref:PTS sugar transporter subunit IIA n=1 Tax=Vibrio sp. CK2-1 TaxID=2912249 RepID=UPI001F19B699|nr:PTS sugar transporter subunit IIA [Vibrio sp. CK2-1]MCF7354977.1 PTS sugar transporter subunit IIA [Vibrio sp. CK2-1]
MQNKRITFYLGSTGLPTWLIKGIHQQVKAFVGSVTLIKVQSLQQVDVKDYLSAMTLAFHPFELCQLVLTGEDAEQYQSQLITFLQTDCFVIETQASSSPTSSNNSLFQIQCFDIEKELNNFTKLYTALYTEQKDQLIQKQYCLKRLSQLTQNQDSQALEEALKKREALSSTAMNNGVALPHLLNAAIDKPQLIILTTNTPVDWGSNFPSVTHIIALMIPIDASKQTLLAVRYLAMALVNSEINQFICQHKHHSELQAIITCFMKLDK